MYKEKHEPKTDMERYAEELKQKVVNIPPHFEHKMGMEDDFQNCDLKEVLEDLELFLKSDLMDFENYEKWLEDDVGPN